MNNKISWYKEVLELEPHSKVFFPLAKLLKNNGQLQEALATLRDGLSVHPEHAEAKLLLAEVLFELGHEDDLNELVQDFSTQIASYPAFWETWADQLSADSSGSEPAVALRFLASFFSGASFTWTEIIETGLKALMSGQNAPKIDIPRKTLSGFTLKQRQDDVEDEAAFEDSEAEDEVDDSEDHAASEESTEAEKSAESGDQGDDDAAMGTNRMRSFESAVSRADVDMSLDDEIDEENEEAFSLRTRTMADLLAEQGDYEGALDIYRELHSCSTSDSERMSLEQLIEEMRTLAFDKAGSNSGRSKKGAAKQRQTAPGKGLKGKKKLISALEALAERLEAKAAN